MKHLYLLLFTVLLSVHIHAQNAPFITTWEVTAGSLDITIPTYGTGYNYTIDFGDGTVQNNVTGDVTYTYNVPGIYTVTISGNFPRIRFGNFSQTDPMLLKIKSVEQWGDIGWTSMFSAFQGCSSLIINATDAPDLSQVTWMNDMFNGATSLNQSINHWNVSNVTHMASMFKNATSFNQPLNSWDVSNVLIMSFMFDNAISFNQSLNSWDVSSVTHMNRIFRSAVSFNQPLNNWDVSNVLYMDGMFDTASIFNQPLNNWNVSNVRNMAGMFRNAVSFNQPLDNWDVSTVYSVAGMFFNATSFDQPLNNWNLSSLLNIGGMFHNATSFNQPLDNWDVSSIGVSNGFYGAFRGASSFNQDLSSWQINIGNLDFFLTDSGMDISNYDTFLTHLVSLNITNGTLGAEGLEYCNIAARNNLINTLGWTIIGDDIDVSCSFNTVQGNIMYDLNNNGCDPNDMPADNIIINANDGTDNYATIPDSNGDYILYLLDDTYTISLLNLPNYFTATPVTSIVNFVGFNNVEIEDFCLTATQSIEDLNITLLPTSEARPGFETDYRLVVRNVGTETIANVEATLEFNDLMQQYVIANPAPSTTTTNTLTFSIGTMQPFQKFEADITMLTFQPPIVNGGDVLNFTATVTPVANDHTPNDNTFNLAQVVVNSYDPNDKQVLQGEELHIDDIDEYLDYLIRFQNTGTASAINVRILDTLHPQLDWSSLIPISASHDYYVNITDGNRVEFMFDNIHLPDSLSNEPASHGFVAYKIKPKSNVQVGDVISGDAAIYFDFNAPIITNMVQTEVVEPLSIADVSNPLNQVFLYPNPANKTLHIHLTDGIELEEVLIYDLQGREVQKIQGKETTLDVEHLRSGMYLLKITTNRGTINRQLIKN